MRARRFIKGFGGLGRKEKKVPDLAKSDVSQRKKKNPY
jgi:hypothetical protein